METPVKSTASLLLFLSAVLVCLISEGCASKGPTRLCADFQSYQTTAEARDTIGPAVASAQWKEETHAPIASDTGPPYQFIYMTGPFKLSGVDGQLKLTFYNGRLMETQFSTRKGREFIAALRQQHSKVPSSASQEIVTDRRTRFRLDVDPDGTFYFTWFDPKLEDEWLRWVWEHD